MSKTICIGSLSVDILIYVEQFAKDDEEKVIKELLVTPGGQAANIASGIGRLGGKVCFFGNIGSDSNTDMLLKEFDKDNVDYSYAKKTKNLNNTCCGIVDSKGQRRLYAYNNIDFDSEDFSDELFKDTKIIIFSSLIKDNIISIFKKIAMRAKARDITIAMDPGSIFANLGFEKLKPLLEECDYIFPNEGEFNQLIEGNKKEELLELVPHVIVTRGDKGIDYYTKGQKVKNFPVPPFKKGQQCIDSTGAGDCFDAGFITKLIETGSVEEAINFGLITAGVSITKKGARAMPTKKEIEAFYNE